MEIVFVDYLAIWVLGEDFFVEGVEVFFFVNDDCFEQFLVEAGVEASEVGFELQRSVF